MNNQKIEEELFKLLFDFKDYNKIKENILKLYSINQRHRYSSITACIINLNIANSNNEEVQTIDKFSSIAENLHIFILSLEDNANTKDKLYKLYDHINLEYIRLDHIENIAIKKINNLNNQAKDITKQLEKDLKESKKLQNQVKSQQTQYITILGIFASIVLVFVANLTFTNSVFSNAHKLDMNQLIFIGGLIALFIGNTIYALFAFIKDIVSEKKYPFKYIILFNIVIIGILLLIFCFRQPTPTSNNLEKQKQETRSTPTNKKEEQHKQEA